MLEKFFRRKQTGPTQPKGMEKLPDTLMWRQARMEQPEFREWFAGSKIVDANGLALPVFHSTRAQQAPWEYEGTSRQSIEFGTHFGTTGAANERLEETTRWTQRDREHTLNSWKDMVSEPTFRKLAAENADSKKSGVVGNERIYPVFLRMRNPIRVRDHGSFAGDNLKKVKKDLLKAISREVDASTIKKASSTSQLRTALIGLGFDGIIYENGVEGGHGKIKHDSFIALLGEDQIWPAFSDKPLNRLPAERPR